MGLDMYLDNRKYIGANYEFNNITGNIELFRDGKKININFDKVAYVVERVAYWRKANAIHNWFVENIQDGVDDCKEYYVSITQLHNLLDKVDAVLNDHSLASTILPSKSGFFFGNTAYDNWYYEDLEYTKEILENIIQNSKPYEDTLYYSSSW
ncbi:MAG: hypothetical protein PHW83_10185 [Bacteroidales bacterium]|nr:hypothetical protein [Bacteroidales bacterium]